MTENHENSGNFADEMAEYLPTFLDETEEQLDDLVETLIVLERDTTNLEALNESFRLIHSIKGSAGIMGFENITVLTHQLENRFEQFRSGKAQLDESTMNLVLRCIDFLRTCNARLRSGQSLSNSSDLLEELRRLEKQQHPPDSSAVEAPEELELEQPKTDLQLAPSNDSSMADSVLARDESLTRIVVRFRAGLQLVDLKTQLIVSRLSSLGVIKQTVPESDKLADFEQLEQFEIFILSEESVARMQSAIEVDGVESIEFNDLAATEATIVPDIEQRQPTPIETQNTSVNPTTSDEPPLSMPSSETGSQANVVTQAAADETPLPTAATPPVSTKRVEPGPTKIAETVRVDVDRLDNLMNLAGELVVNRARFEQISADVNPEMRKANMLNRIREFRTSLLETIEGMEGSTRDASEWSMRIKQLRSGADLLQEQSEIWSNGRQFVNEVGDAIDQLTRVSQKLRQGVLDTRMIPVAPLFNRFKRLVRDLSVERNKQVNLSIRGESTELDKRMIDELGDPLVHLVRNSIDHGLESSEQRTAVGKPVPGTIKLAASHRGNNVFILVSDDGSGIDAEKIRAKLVERNILSASDAEALSYDDALAYIWHPGFSTAGEVTDVSGRGVGMDVVRTRIEKLNGTIHVDSELGEGTTFTIRLPLTLAIINSLLVRCRTTTFSIPMDDVREIVSVESSKIVSAIGKQTIEVRGQYVPLLAVDEIFDWHDTDYRGLNGPINDDGLANGNVQIVVLQSGGKTFGLRVEELLGSQDLVIKSLSDNFMSIPGLSGASILGDGNVCLMLEVASFIGMAIKSSQDAQNQEPKD